MESDKETLHFLLNQCKENNQKAQFTLYKMYYKAMYNVTFRIVSDAQIAEDCMQESFLKAFTKLDSYSGNVSFGAWLKKIVINESINQLKKEKQLPFEKIEEHPAITENENDDTNQEYQTLKTNDILNAIQSLKTNYKVIITLHFIEGFDQEEIAEILTISNENCRTQLHRAKESLRKKLQLK